MAQTITKKPGEDILIVDEPTTELPPPTGTVDVVAGTTTTLAPGTPATVVKDPASTATKTIFNFGIPQGIKGDKGDKGDAGTGSGGTISLGKGYADLRNFDAKGDGVDDDSDAFQRAWDSIKSTGGKLYYPQPNNFYNFKNTFNAIPDGSNQAWIDMECINDRVGKIRYTGPSNQPAIRILGLKGGIWKGVHLAIDNGRTNCQAVDIVTTEAANSSSFVTFKNFYLNLGNGTDNVGIRTGIDSPKDISNYEFENLAVYGGGGLYGAAVTGQYAFQNLGINTLSMAWKGGFVAHCDRIYSNISRDGSKRGNGCADFYALGGAHNNVDFVFAWEQCYGIWGGRFENGNKHLQVVNGGYSAVTMESYTVHDYRQDNQIEALFACSLKMTGIQISKTMGGVYNNCVNVQSNNGKNGVLTMENCAFSLNKNQAYTKQGSAQWGIRCENNMKLAGVQANGFLDDFKGRI